MKKRVISKSDRIIGSIFSEIRQERGITQAAIAEGLVTQRAVSNLEQRGELPNCLVLEMLLQRAGKNGDYFLTMLSRQEYRYLSWRKDIVKTIREGNISEADWETENARDRSIHRGLQEQFVAFWKGYTQGDIALMKKAIGLTVPRYPEELPPGCCISTREIAYILLCVEKRMELYPEQWAEEQDMLRAVLAKAEKDFQEDERVKVYGRAACLYGESMQGAESYEKLLYYRKALELNRTQMNLQDMEALLRGFIREAERIGQKDIQEYRDALWALELVRREAGETEEPFFCFELGREYYLLHEVLRSYRRERKLALREIDEKACSGKTYRALESGKRGVNAGTYEALAELMEIPFGTYSSDIITDKYSDLQMAEEHKMLARRGQREEALELLDRLEASLGDKMEYKQNQQFIGAGRNFYLLLMKKLPPEEYLQRMEKLLRLTIPNWHTDHVQYFYTRQEIVMIDYLAVAYRRTHQPETAIKLLEKVWDTLEHSDVDKRYRMEEVLLILSLWKDLLTDVKQYEEALEKAKEGIRWCFASGKGDKLIIFIFEFGWCLERQFPEIPLEQKKAKCAEYFKSALLISKLFYMKEDQEIIERYMEKGAYKQ